MGPWGWQWRDGVRELVSALPSPTRVTIKALMDDIEKVKDAEGYLVLFVADKECLGCTGDVQNHHRLGLFKISRVPFHR